MSPRHQLHGPPPDQRARHVRLTVLTLGLWAVTGWPVSAWRQRRREAAATTTERVAYL